MASLYDYFPIVLVILCDLWNTSAMSRISRLLIRECIYTLLALLMSLSGVLLSYSGVLSRYTDALLGDKWPPPPPHWVSICDAPYADKRFSPAELAPILEAHQLWLDTDAKQGRQAKLCAADLSGVNLWEANLRRAELTSANLRGVPLNEADLREAKLVGAKLQGAALSKAKLSEADLSGADLSSVIFELQPGTLPHVPSFALAQNLSQMMYRTTPHALVELREALKKAGMRTQEREVTFAIKHGERQNAVWAESIVQLILFEWPCNYGMSPGRPLRFLLWLIPICALFYWIALRKTNNRHGIWMIVPADRLTRGRGKEKAFVLRTYPAQTWRMRVVGECRRLRLSLYFSLLSAFHIGWREFNVGTWIARLQGREYTLRAKGWVRIISGLQSLVSVYLLAVAVLSYFGRPFE